MDDHDHENQGDVIPIYKADTIEAKVPSAQSRASLSGDDSMVTEYNAVDSHEIELEPFPLPYGFQDPKLFLDIWRKSSALQPPIEAYASDIDGMGYTFEPTFDPGADDALDELREAHEAQRAWMESFGEVDEKGKPINTLPEPPTDEELEAELADLKKKSRQQKFKAEYFFRSAVRESSFTRMRKNTRQHCEIGGNWYWEVVRRLDQPSRLKLVPFQSMRIAKEEKEPFEIESKIQVSPIHWSEIKEPRYFRRYVQKVSATEYRYFKQYGDPRIMCSHCGRYYPKAAKNIAAAQREAYRNNDEQFVPATEILHDGAVEFSGSPYFLPRWIGAINFVLGEDAASDMNLSYFNNPMPAGMLLCAGGKFADEMKDSIKEHFAQMITDSRGFHKIIAISAVSSQKFMKAGAAPAKVSLDWVPLIKDRPNDAQHLQYMRYCEEKVGRQFRLHILLFGGSGALNKATAWAVLKFAEERVYQPLRTEMDDVINRTLMRDLGITLWRFKSKAPETRDPATRVRLLEILQNGPALSVDEIRELSGEVVNREYKPYGEDWSQHPWRMLEFVADEGKTSLNEAIQEEANRQQEIESDEFEDHTQEVESDEMKPEG